MKRAVIASFLFLLAAAMQGQFFQFGGSVGFFDKQTVYFDSPPVLDSSFSYNENGMFVPANKLEKKKKTNTPALYAYVNYRFTQRHYAGVHFGYHYNHLNADRSDEDDDRYPEVTLHAPSLGLSYGYTRKKGIFNYYIEGGLSATRLNFIFGQKDYGDWIYAKPSESRSRYENYFNQKNTFLTAHTAAGINLLFLNLGLRYDFQVADIINKSRISKINYRPTITVGIDFRSGFVGKKRYHLQNDGYTQLDDDVKFEEKYDYGRLELEYGGGMNISRLKPKDIPVIAYKDVLAIGTYQSQIHLKEKWTSRATGFYAALKYAPFRGKKTTLILYGNTGQIQGKETSAGTFVENQYLYPNNSIKSVESSLGFKAQSYHFGLGVGRRIRVNNKSFVELAALYGYSAFSLQPTDNVKGDNFTKQYFVMKAWGGKSAGIQVNYKIKHAGIGVKVLQALNSPDETNRLNATYYNISIFWDSIFRH